MIHRINNQKKEEPSPDNIYVNVEISNNSDVRGKKAVYEQTRLNPIVDNPSNYYLSLIRWKIPSYSFPISTFPIQKNQPNPNLSEYSITFETSTNIYQYFLFYLPRTATTLDDTDEPLKYYFIYEYQHMVDMVNQAFIMCHDNVTGKPAGSQPPFMIYNEVTKLFSVVAQLSQYGVNLQPTPLPPSQPINQPDYDADIKVYFNYKLFSRFSALPFRTIPIANATQGRDVQLLFSDYGNNTYSPTEIIITQNYPSISLWNPVKSILFITNVIPVRGELTTNSGNATRKIITDFQPTADSSNDVRSTLQYFNQGVYRLSDLTGSKAIYDINLEVKWLDIDGNEFYVEVTQFQQLTAKLLFVKRNLFKSDNLLYEN